MTAPLIQLRWFVWRNLPSTDYRSLIVGAERVHKAMAFIPRQNPTSAQLTKPPTVGGWRTAELPELLLYRVPAFFVGFGPDEKPMMTYALRLGVEGEPGDHYGWVPGSNVVLDVSEREAEVLVRYLPPRGFGPVHLEALLSTHFGAEPS